MQKQNWRTGLGCLYAVALVGCTATAISAPSPAPPANSAMRERNEGYSLLYGLMSDESNVDKLLIVKHADKPLHELVNGIADFARDVKTQMDNFKKGDGTLSTETPDLPVVEQETRDQTSKADAKELLTTSGKAFELQLVFTQTQAMGYGAEIAKAVETHDDNPARKDFLRRVSRQCGVFRDRLMGDLAVK